MNQKLVVPSHAPHHPATGTLMRILIYKRTHTGDPNVGRQFGNEGCMGRVRGFAFDAVIGVGGIGGQPRKQGISGKINWVGRNPRKSRNPVDARGPLVSFDSLDFRLFEQQGPSFLEHAPLLAKKVFGNRSRFVFRSLTPAEQREAELLIRRVLDAGEFDHLQRTKTIASACDNVCWSAVQKRACSRRRQAVSSSGHEYRTPLKVKC